MEDNVFASDNLVGRDMHVLYRTHSQMCSIMT